MSGVELTTTIGTVDVENLCLRLLAHGVWDATMDIAGPTAPAELSAATLRIARSTSILDTFTGVVRRAQVTPGTQNLSVTIVGGSGRNLETIAARHHTAGASTVPAGLVLRGIADAAGYTLAAGVESALDAYPLQRYTRVQGEAWAALNVRAYTLSTMSVFAVDWRVLSDGTLWMGSETWLPVVDARAYYYRGDPRDGAVLFIPDGAPYRPGTFILSGDTNGVPQGGRVVECCYRTTPGRPIMEARVQVPGDPVWQAPLQPYARSYVATVVSQNADMTLNLRAADPVLGQDLRNVPFKLGIPGTKVVVPAGAIVRVAFESGLPTGIYAGDIDLDAAATKAFALKDDTVASGSLTASVTDPVSGVLAVNFIYKGGAPATSINISGTITGPCHKFARGVPDA